MGNEMGNLANINGDEGGDVAAGSTETISGSADGHEHDDNLAAHEDRLMGNETAPRADLSPILLSMYLATSWKIMPMFIERVLAFSVEHDAQGARRACDRYMEAFSAGSKEWFGLALMDPDGVMKGHLLACIETRAMTGDRYAMVWQWTKDVSCDHMVDYHCKDLLELWARSQGVTRISALSLSKGRSRLFKRFGFKPGPQVVTCEVGNG